MVSIMRGVVVVSTTLQGVSVFPNSGAQSERVLLSTTHFFWSAATTSSMTCTVQNGKASDIYLTVTPCCDFHPDESSPLVIESNFCSRIHSIVEKADRPRRREQGESDSAPRSAHQIRCERRIVILSGDLLAVPTFLSVDSWGSFFQMKHMLQTNFSRESIHV